MGVAVENSRRIGVGISGRCSGSSGSSGCSKVHIVVLALVLVLMLVQKIGIGVGSSI